MDDPPSGEQTYFERQREALVSEITVNLEKVLMNMNALNRALESAVVVGKEFENVSQLWSTFYDGMAHYTNDGEQDEDDEDIEEQYDDEDDDEEEEEDEENEVRRREQAREGEEKYADSADEEYGERGVDASYTRDMRR
ncbi:DASH complex subunit Dad1-domain-containing protein [Limtongia smithiae]|uniref:DASH complex subunit Dad1-domain-containing protein n=1 Tax=Limtongia smithiae TaxID=1125753 RepID=UPI0034CDBCE6